MSKYSKCLSFLSQLRLKIPLIQAPMAGISTVKLASVVTNNGGVGSIPFGAVDLRNGIEPIVKQIDEFKKLTGDSNLVNLNFFCQDFEDQVEPSDLQKKNWINLYKKVIEQDIENKIAFKNSNISFSQIESECTPQFEELLEYLISYKPKVVSFHFGYPSKRVFKALQDSGTLVFVTATSVQEAQALLDIGVDGIICQGYEAGGHRGNFISSSALDENLSTSALFAQVLELLSNSTKKPHIIPAGGIVNGIQAEYYLASGASAVQMGTAFLAVPESNSNEFIKRSVLDKCGRSTIMTRLVSGKNARTIKTDFITKLVLTHLENPNSSLPAYGYSYSAFKDLLRLLGDEKYGFYLAGQNYHLIDPNLNTCEILDRFSNELKNAGYSTF